MELCIMISLSDAVERARTMAGDDGLLNQESYDVLVEKLDETDRYAFTMALLDNGILTRTGMLDKPEGKSLEALIYGQEQAEDKEPVSVKDRMVEAFRNARNRGS